MSRPAAPQAAEAPEFVCRICQLEVIFANGDRDWAGAAVGVTDDDRRARKRAAAAMLANGAASAVVETAVYNQVRQGLEAGYELAGGMRWDARRRGSRVYWSQRLVPVAVAS